MLTQEQQELRLRILDLAVRAGSPDLCRHFLDFVTGKSDQSPRQAIDAALDKLEAKGA